MTIHAFRNMVPVQTSADGGPIFTKIYSSQRIFEKQIWGTIVFAAEALPPIAHVGQYHTSEGKHYYVWSVFDQHTTQNNPLALRILLTSAIATVLVCLTPSYYKAYATLPGVGFLVTLGFIRHKVPHNVQSRWVEHTNTATPHYRNDGINTHITMHDSPALTPKNQFSELSHVRYS